MGLMNKIEKIRKQPENVRRRYAFIWAAISMVFIVIIWFVSLSGAQPPVKEEEKIRQDQLYQEMGSQKKSLQDSLKEMGDSYQNLRDTQNKMMDQAGQDASSDTSGQQNQSLEQMLNQNPTDQSGQDNSGQGAPDQQTPTQETPTQQTPTGEVSAQ